MAKTEQVVREERWCSICNAKTLHLCTEQDQVCLRCGQPAKIHRKHESFKWPEGYDGT